VVVVEDGERVSGLSDLDELLIIDGELAHVPASSGLVVVARRLIERRRAEGSTDDLVGQLRAFHGLHHSIGGVPNAVVGLRLQLVVMDRWNKGGPSQPLGTRSGSGEQPMNGPPGVLPICLEVLVDRGVRARGADDDIH